MSIYMYNTSSKDALDSRIKLEYHQICFFSRFWSKSLLVIRVFFPLYWFVNSFSSSYYCRKFKNKTMFRALGWIAFPFQVWQLSTSLSAFLLNVPHKKHNSYCPGRAAIDHWVKGQRSRLLVDTLLSRRY